MDNLFRQVGIYSTVSFMNLKTPIDVVLQRVAQGQLLEEGNTEAGGTGRGRLPQPRIQFTIPNCYPSISIIRSSVFSALATLSGLRRSARGFLFGATRGAQRCQAKGFSTRMVRAT